MFKVKANPTYEHEVTVPTAAGPEKVTFTFKHRTRDALKAFLADIAEKQVPDEDVLMDIAVGWAGTDEPFTREAVAEAVQNHHAGFVQAVMDGYVDSLTQARRGN